MAQSKYGKYLVAVPIREVGASLNVKGRTKTGFVETGRKTTYPDDHDAGHG